MNHDLIYPLSAPRYAFVPRLYLHNPAGAQAWVEQTIGALIMDRVGEVLYEEPWHHGLAVGADAVEGACKHIRVHYDLNHRSP